MLNCGGSCAVIEQVIFLYEIDEPNASLVLNLYEGGPSHATGENVYTLSMFLLLKVLEI
jgi:hypothetical protein